MPRIIDSFTQFFDDDGAPLIDGWLKFNESGTNNTDKDTFADINESIANTNPVQLDGAGRCPNIFGSGAYNVISFTDNNGVPGQQIQQFDPVGGNQEGGALEDWDSLTIYSDGGLVTGSDGMMYRSLEDGNQGNDPVTSPTKWEEVLFSSVWNSSVIYAEDDAVIGSDGFYYLSRTGSNTGNDPISDAVNWKTAIIESGGDPVASSTTLDIWDNDGNTRHVTGTVDITTFANAPRQGIWSKIIFDDSLVITHGSGITLPGGKNITTVAGDIAFVYADTVSSFEVTYFKSGGNSFESELLHIQDQKASGTDGGTFTSGAWQTRDLSPPITNEISGASSATNQITLPAGSYYIEAGAIANNVNSHKVKLYNITDASDELIGLTMREPTGTGDNSNQVANISGRFTLDGEEVLEIQHQCGSTQATTGYGAAASFGVIEIYADVKIWKVG